MARRFPIRLLSSFLFVGLIFAASVDAGRKKQPAKPINLNTATSEELQLVPGIGPATADKILQMRKSYGGFKSVDDLLAIRGLGEAAREDAQVFDCWEAGSGKDRDPIGEVHSSYKKATKEVIREILTAKYARRGSGPRFARNDRCRRRVTRGGASPAPTAQE